MMSTWAASEPLRHPWFTTASLKRKHSNSSDEDTARDPVGDQDGEPVLYPTPPPESESLHDSDSELNERKRRRCDTIERRMAQMYIDTRPGAMMNSGVAYNQEVHPGLHAPLMSAAQSNASDASYAYTAGSISPVSQNSILPQYAVEEPVSPEFLSNPTFSPFASHADEPTIAEVRMKGAELAWYEREKDRIVITDLDEAAEEGEEQREEEEEYKSEAEPHPDAADWADSNADYSVSSILLDHIKRQSNFPFVPKSKKKKNEGALVLFRPPPASFFDGPNSDENENALKHEVQVEEINSSEAHAFTPSGNFTVGTVFMDQEETDLGDPMDMDVDIEM